MPCIWQGASSDYNGHYNKGSDVQEAEDGTLSGYTDKDVWTVIANDNGTYSFAYGGENLAMGDQYTSMPLGEKTTSGS